MMKEFTDFLKQYGVIGLAIAVIIGGKLGDLVKALVDGLLMPFIGVLIPNGDWRSYVTPGPIKFQVGLVAGAAIDFVIVAFVVFWIAKKIMRADKVEKI